MAEIDLYRSTPRKVREFTLDILYAGLVPFITASPGVGKSSLMRSIAKHLNLFVIDHRLSTSVPEDMSGLPRFDQKGYAYFAPFRELFPLADAVIPAGYDGWLIFLDEFNSAKKEVQAAAYKLILDRMVGQHHLHDNCLIACAGNLMTDRAIVNPIGTAMQSRVIHLEMEVNFDEWLQDVAIPEHYDTRIIAYLSQYPSKLMDFKPDHKDKTFACPRTWEFMNKLVHGMNITQDKLPMYAGTITSSMAADFVQFVKVFDKMVSVEQILKDPEECPLPMDNSTCWAVISSIMEKINEENFGKLAKYANRFDTPFRILFFRSVMIRQPGLRQHPAFAQALIKLQQYLTG